MPRRRKLQVGSVVWAVTGAAVALASVPTANDDAKLLVALASVIFPLSTLSAAVLLRHRHDRLAGLLLLTSVATPTYFAYPLNLPALIVGLALLTSPAATVGEQRNATPLAL